MLDVELARCYTALVLQLSATCKLFQDKKALNAICVT